MAFTRLLFTALSLLFLSTLNAQFEHAEFGELDLGYNIDGFLTFDNEEKGDCVMGLIVQPDGKILLLGTSNDLTNNDLPIQYVLIRFEIDGTLDASFGDNGITTLPSDFKNSYSYTRRTDPFVLQPDGKILLAGRGDYLSDNHDLILLRYTSEGVLDNTFGTDGKRIIEFDQQHSNDYALCLQSDSKLIVGTTKSIYSDTANLMLLRFLPDGQLDSTFGTDGIVITDIEKREIIVKIMFLPDGKILTVGHTSTSQSEKSDFALARFLPNGMLDETFGNGGKRITNIGISGKAYATDGLIQKDGKIIVAGHALGAYQPDYAMVRYHPDGQLDKTFGNQGKVISNISPHGDWNPSIVIQPDDKIVLAGNSMAWASHLTLVRYNPNGRIDYSFGEKGKQRPYLSIHGSFVKKVTLQNNKIILAGCVRLEDSSNSDFLLIRYLSDFNVGIVDFALNTNETLVYPNPIKNTATLEYTLTDTEQISIQLVDIQGRILSTFLDNKKQLAGKYQQAIELPLDLPKSAYFINIVSPNGQVSVKVLK